MQGQCNRPISQNRKRNDRKDAPLITQRFRFLPNGRFTLENGSFRIDQLSFRFYRRTDCFFFCCGIGTNPSPLLHWKRQSHLCGTAFSRMQETGKQACHYPAANGCFRIPHDTGRHQTTVVKDFLKRLDGGRRRNRTDVYGFAGRCLTAWLTHHKG